MEALRQRLYDGMATKGITGAAADDIYTKIKSFAAFGFPVHSPSRHVSEPRLVAA
jgi:error-prone DNA polymerase